jgi:hypothetical protein
LTQPTTDPSTTKTFGKLKSKSLLTGIVTFLLVTLSLFHIFFESNPPKVANVVKEYRQVIKNRNNLRSSHLEDLKNRKVSIDEYYAKVTSLIEQSEKEIKSLNLERKALSQAFSFRGRKSFHFWIFAFGLVTALLYFSSKSLYKEIKEKQSIGFQINSILGVTVSFFWMIHLIFFTEKDFAKNSYVVFIFLCAVAGAISIYLLMRYRVKLAIKKLEKERELDEFQRLGFEFINKVNESLLKG